MTKQQKWAVVGAIWVAAIGIFLLAFRGRYQHLPPEYIENTEVGRPQKFDTWTGNAYVYDVGRNRWDRVILEHHLKDK